MNTKSKPLVLVVGDGAAPTGYARVIHSVFSRLAGRYRVEQLATHYEGAPHEWPWRLHPTDGARDPLGEAALLPLVARLRPDLVFVVNDPVAARRYAAQLAPWRQAGGGRLAAYCPVDVAPLSPELVAPLAGTDLLATYTEFGRDVLRAALAAAGDGVPPACPPLHRVPHGVDARTFFPLDAAPLAAGGPADRSGARRRLFGDAPGLGDAFIVLNANRNQPRKRIDLTIEGFARFARGKPADVHLYLHMGVKDCGWDVRALAQRHGVYERLMMTTDQGVMPFVDDATLNLIYNACDVGVNTAAAEGWGLASFEHAATGAAQVVPDHTALRELWAGAAVPLPRRLTLTDPAQLYEEHLTAPEDLAAALERLYADSGYRARMSRAAYANALRPEWSWDAVAERWGELLDACLARKTAPP
ncbi:MAG TPA: glycosyltransferase family 4 protein [Longimicrobium sp.]|nr:glycosyltransferase family 4 protein [Longimicrobium sp.]